MLNIWFVMVEVVVGLKNVCRSVSASRIADDTHIGKYIDNNNKYFYISKMR